MCPPLMHQQVGEVFRAGASSVRAEIMPPVDVDVSVHAPFIENLCETPLCFWSPHNRENKRFGYGDKAV
jgi:hypothetical protein